MKQPPTISRGNSITLTAVAYLAALFCAILVVHATSLSHPLAQLALGDLVATIVIFLFSVALNNSSMYDPYWSVKPVVFAVYYLMIAIPDAGLAIPDTGLEIIDPGSRIAGYGSRILIVTLLIVLYSLRLTSNFFRDWQGLKHEDWRYRDFRKQFPKGYWLVSFFGIHLFPTVMVYLGCLPLFGIWQAGDTPLNLVDLVGGVVLLAAIVIAFVADEQLRRFRKDPASRGVAITTGLWSLSRHPNYLGEILTWWGLFLFALAAGIGYYWSGIGAVLITLMFVFVSIPMIEKRNLLSRKGYADYIQQVPELLPKLW